MCAVPESEESHDSYHIYDKSALCKDIFFIWANSVLIIIWVWDPTIHTINV